MSEKVSHREYELTGTLTSEYQLTIDFLHLQGMKNLLRGFIDKELVIKVKERIRKRSEAQNRYYWGILIPTVRAFLKETEGKTYTEDQLHTYHLMKVIGAKPVITEILGLEVVSFEVKRSSKMSTKEFGEFVDILQAYWAERDLVVSDPKGDNFISDHLKP